ncbi:MAG: hypothetical protein ONB05_02385 [candidate division KSB1 bacterium]|nr:hypothetical protein [candidate division KSB1 bacterium]
MRSFLNITPEDRPPDPGDGPEDDPRFPARTLRSHGFLALAFGFALGLTLMIFFGLFRAFGAPTSGLADFVSRVNPNLWLSFLCGFIGGTLISAIYNFLIFRRLNLFGLDRNMD